MKGKNGQAGNGGSDRNRFRRVLLGCIEMALILVLCGLFLPRQACADEVSGNFSMQPFLGSPGSCASLSRNSVDCHPKFLALLRQKDQYLDKKKEDIHKKEQDLEFLRREMDSKVKILKDLQRSLQGPVKKKRYQEQAKLQHLAGVYGAMEPARAAVLLDKMDEDTVTKLFSIMKGKKVAPILARMSPDRAARISAYLYRRPPEP